MRGFVVFLVVVALVALGGDSAARWFVANRTEASLAADGMTDPKVGIEGFPFLTQLARGRFDTVKLEAPVVTAQGSRLRSVLATGHDVGLPTNGNVDIGRLRAEALVTYAEVLRQGGLDGELSRAPGGRVRLRGDITIIGETLPVTALAKVTADGRRLRIEPESLELGGGRTLTASLTGSITDRFTLTYRVRGLPKGTVLKKVTARRDGLFVELTGTDVTLTSAAAARGASPAATRSAAPFASWPAASRRAAPAPPAG